MGHHYDRGTMLFNLRRFREAVTEFTAELGDDPRSIEAYGMRGMCHLKLREFKKCHSDVQEAIALDPEWSYSYYVLSIAALAKGRSREALKQIEEALRLQKSPAYFYQLAAVEFSREHFDPALKATEAALALDPRDVDNLVLRAKILTKTGKLEEARRLLETALAIEPERPGTHRELGSINLLRGSADRALGHLVEARRIDPVRYNERQLLASAYGRLQWPWVYIDTLWRWMQGWTAKQRWLALVSMMTSLVGVLLITKPSLEHFSWMGAVLFAVVANGLVLLATYPTFGKYVVFFTLRRDLGIRWYDYFFGLFELPKVLIAHVAVTFAAGLGTTIPELYYFVFAMVVLNWDLFWLLMRPHFIVGVLLIPVLGSVTLWFAIGGTFHMPNDPWLLLRHWLMVVLSSLLLVLLRSYVERRSERALPLESATL